MTQNEYIIPLTPTTKDLSLYRRPSNQDSQYKIKHSIPNMDASVSIRPTLYITEKQINTRSVKTSDLPNLAGKMRWVFCVCIILTLNIHFDFYKSGSRKPARSPTRHSSPLRSWRSTCCMLCMRPPLKERPTSGTLWAAAMPTSLCQWPLRVSLSLLITNNTHCS